MCWAEKVLAKCTGKTNLINYIVNGPMKAIKLGGILSDRSSNAVEMKQNKTCIEVDIR